MTIRGKVAAILNERDLVINKGGNDGISEGMPFQVTQPDVPVIDPDSGAELGVLCRDKIKVKVVEVHPQFSVAKTYETYSAPDLSLGRSEPGGVQRMVTRARKILTEKSDPKTVVIGATGSTVNIGDPVIQITE